MFGLIGFFEDVFFLFAIVKFAGGGIDGDGNLFAWLVASGGDGFEDALHGFDVGFQVWGEAAFVADSRGVAIFLQDRFQAMENLYAPAQGFVKIGGAERHDHEFLDVHGIIGVRATVQNIHHGNGEGIGVALG